MQNPGYAQTPHPIQPVSNSQPMHMGAQPAGHAHAGTTPAGQAAPFVNGPMAVAATNQAPKEKPFVEALFDFKFEYFVTPKVMKVVYALQLIGIVITFLAFEYDYWSGSYQNDNMIAIFVIPMFVPMGFVVARVMCELMLAPLRMAELLRGIANKNA